MRLPTFAEWLQRKMNEMGEAPGAAGPAAPTPPSPSGQQAKMALKANLQKAQTDPSAVSDPEKAVNKATLGAVAMTDNPKKAMDDLTAPAPGAPAPARMRK